MSIRRDKRTTLERRALSPARLGRLGAPAGLYVPVTVLGQEVDFLYDTGASCTVISARVWDRIPAQARPELEHPSVTLTTVGDHAIENFGACSLTLEVDGRPITCKAQVCDITEEAVLGLDVLSALKCHWDWDKGVLTRGPSQAEPGLGDDRCSQEHIGGRSSDPRSGSQQPSAPGEAESPTESRGDAEDMEVMQEPCLGLEELWPSTGRSPSVEMDWEERLAGLIRSAARSDAPERAGASAPTRQKGAPEVGPPDHLTQLLTDDTAQLSEGIRAQFATMLEKFRHVFSENDQDLGRTGLEVHHIPTGNARPIRLPPRRAPMHLRADIEQQVQAMLAQGIVEECTSPWAAPLVVVKKKDGSNRICVDYRALNDVTEKDGHPIPRIGDSIDALAGAAIFSTLDMTSGYHQVEVAEGDRDKTAFVTGRGHHLRFVTMPFGLCNAPSTFQRLMERVLQGLIWKNTVVYLDDVVIFSKTPEEHVRHLAEVLERFERHNLKLKPRKCEFFRSEVRYLGHVVSATGVATDPGLIDKVTAWDPPRTQRQVRAFLGLTGYYRSYVPDYGDIAEPLVRLTDARAEFKWTSDCQKAFEELKQRLVSAPILAYPNQEDPFLLDTDASDVAIGAVLSQRQAGVERVIAYGSKALSKEERNYCVTRRELLAVVHFVETYRYYLYGRPFVVRTDHSSLRWLLRQKEPRDQLARWIQRLSAYQFSIEHRPGKRHGNADGMSRKCFRGGECFHPAPGDGDVDAPPGTVTTHAELTGEAASAARTPSPEHGTADEGGPVLSPAHVRQVDRRAVRLAGIQAAAQPVAEPNAQAGNPAQGHDIAPRSEQLHPAVLHAQRATTSRRAPRRKKRAPRDVPQSPDGQVS